MIKKIKKGNRVVFVLFSSDGSKKLGEFSSRAEAIKREKQIVFFKNLRKSPALRRKIKKKSLLKKHPLKKRRKK